MLVFVWLRARQRAGFLILCGLSTTMCELHFYSMIARDLH